MNQPLDSDVPNNSGTGTSAHMPPEIRGFSWGAFWWSWIWAIAHNTWIGLLALVPEIGLITFFALNTKRSGIIEILVGFSLIISILLAFKGNEWAWQNRRWSSSAEFLKVQRRWAYSGFLIAGGATALMFFAVYPVYEMTKYNALRSSSNSNMLQIGLGMAQYTQDYDELYPPLDSPSEVQRTIMPYVKSNEIFTSPLTHTNYEWAKQLSLHNSHEIETPYEMPLLWESIADQQGTRGVAFADGHVQWMSETDWQTTRARLDNVAAATPTSPPIPQTITLTAENASFRRQTFYGQHLDAVLVFGGKQMGGSDISSEIRTDYRVVKWTLTVTNPTDLQVNSIDYVTTYYSALGSPVSNSLGLTGGAAINQSKNIPCLVAPHSSQALTLYDLVTVTCYDETLGGKGRILVTSSNLSSVLPPSAPSTSPEGQTGGSTPTGQLVTPDLSDLHVGMTVYDVNGLLLGKIVDWNDHQFDDGVEVGLCIEVPDPDHTDGDEKPRVWQKASMITQVIRIYK